MELVDLEAEVRLWGGSGEGDASVRVDAQRLAALLLRQCFGRVVALNEVRQHGGQACQLAAQSRRVIDGWFGMGG